MGVIKSAATRCKCSVDGSIFSGLGMVVQICLFQYILFTRCISLLPMKSTPNVLWGFTDQMFPDLFSSFVVFCARDADNAGCLWHQASTRMSFVSGQCPTGMNPILPFHMELSSLSRGPWRPIVLIYFLFPHGRWWIYMKYSTKIYWPKLKIVPVYEPCCPAPRKSRKHNIHSSMRRYFV